MEWHAVRDVRLSVSKRATQLQSWTVGVKMCRDDDGRFYVIDVVRIQGSPITVQRTIANTAMMDGTHVDIILPEDPGAAGKADLAHYIRASMGPRSGERGRSPINVACVS